MQRTNRFADQPNRAPSPDRLLWSTDLVTIGQFRAGVDHPHFHDSGPIERPIFVFPRTSVTIRHEGQKSFTADPCTVTFYNRGQRYTREPADPRGDLCEWFAVRPDVLLDALARHDVTVWDRADRPFAHPFGPSDATSYAVQRALVRYVGGGGPPDPLAVDEAVLRLLNRVLALAGGESGGSPSPPGQGPSRATAHLAQDVRTYLLGRFRDDSTLDDIARAVGSSVFHLCRVFRSETGMTIHRYRHQLRLRRALELVAEPGSNITVVALQLGFSSHSHFSAAFRAAFATTPSGFRRRPSARRIRELAARLETATTRHRARS